MEIKEIITLKNVFFSYTKKPFLENINLSVSEKEFVGIIGPNGGGKTTLLKLILGILTPDSGTVELFGNGVKKNRKKVGYLSQFKDIDFDFPITVYEVVLLGRLKGSLFNFYSKEDHRLVDNSLKRLGLWESRNKKLGDLSGGQKQRVFVARALVNSPEILVLDEPMSNLDISIQEELYEILKELNKKMAIIVVDHDLEMIQKYVSKVICVNKCNAHTIRAHNSQDLKKRIECHV